MLSSRQTVPANIVAYVGSTDHKINIWNQGVYCQVGTCGRRGIDVHGVVINGCHLHMQKACDEKALS